MLYCFTPNINNVCFWFSPKCGCTFIRKLYSYLTGALTSGILPIKLDKNNINSYKNILFTRNPYKRIVSGFLDCYVQNNKFDVFTESLSLSTLLDNLIQNGFENVDELHFQKQLSYEYNDNIIFDKIYDIENIDYIYLNSLFQNKIDDNIIKVFKFSPHHVKYDENLYIENSHLLTTKDLEVYKKYPSRKSFLNKIIEDKINIFYKEDIDFFKSHNLNYIC